MFVPSIPMVIYLVHIGHSAAVHWINRWKKNGGHVLLHLQNIPGNIGDNWCGMISGRLKASYSTPNIFLLVLKAFFKFKYYSSHLAQGPCYKQILFQSRSTLSHCVLWFWSSCPASVWGTAWTGSQGVWPPDLAVTSHLALHPWASGPWLLIH